MLGQVVLCEISDPIQNVCVKFLLFLLSETLSFGLRPFTGKTMAHVYEDVCMCVMCVYVSVSMFVYVCVVCACMYVCVHVFPCMCVQACVCKYVCVCMCVQCMCV